jgi:superfamily II DNA or RNA helicase
MNLILENPVKLKIEGISEIQKDQLKAYLTYTDKSVVFEISRIKKNIRWFKTQEAFDEKIKSLKEESTKCLLFEDETGIWTYSGFLPYIEEKLKIKASYRFSYPETKLLPWYSDPGKKMYPYQEEALEKLLEARHAGVQIGCHRKGEKVLMFDGSIKNVEDVVVGDQLMGPDSNPRIVQELCRGLDSMYELETVNGQKMVVNGNHILALRQTCRNSTYKINKKRRSNFKGSNPVTFITVNDYLLKSNKFKHLNKLFSVPVSFPDKEVPLDPYFLGLLLGDGSWSGTPAITTADREIVSAINSIAETFNLKVREAKQSNNKSSTYFLTDSKASCSRPNRLTKILRDLGVWGTSCSEKYIPHIYIANSSQKRLELLAGLIDTDGSLSGGCFDFVSKSAKLASGVAFLSRSLGFRVTEKVCQKSDQNGTVGTYFRLTISGEISQIPTRLPRKRAADRKQIKSPNSFGFSVKKVADQEPYYGFVLNSDHLYLTDTFLVTHNTGLGKTFILANLIKRLGLKTVVMAPNTGIAEQIFLEFQKLFGEKYVGAYFDGRKTPKKLIVIANAQSLTRVKPDHEHWEVLNSTQVFIADESHQCPASTLASVCFGVLADSPYRFFFSATQLRNDGSGILLDGITGPIVYEMSVREGVDKGFLARPQFHIKHLPPNGDFVPNDVNEATRHHLYYNPAVVREVGRLCNLAAARGLPVVVLIEEVEQFTKLLPYLKFQAGFAHGTLTENKSKVPKEYWESDPNKLVAEFNELKYPILIGTSCISTGTDIRAVKFLIYWQGGKSEIQVKQAIGRGTRKIPGKDKCFVTDFHIDPPEDVRSWPIGKHAQERKRIYEELYPPVFEE